MKNQRKLKTVDGPHGRRYDGWNSRRDSGRWQGRTVGEEVAVRLVGGMGDEGGKDVGATDGEPMVHV